MLFKQWNIATLNLRVVPLLMGLQQVLVLSIIRSIAMGRDSDRNYDYTVLKVVAKTTAKQVVRLLVTKQQTIRVIFVPDHPWVGGHDFQYSLYRHCGLLRLFGFFFAAITMYRAVSFSSGESLVLP